MFLVFLYSCYRFSCQYDHSIIFVYISYGSDFWVASEASRPLLHTAWELRGQLSIGGKSWFPWSRGVWVQWSFCTPTHTYHRICAWISLKYSFLSSSMGTKVCCYKLEFIFQSQLSFKCICDFALLYIVRLWKQTLLSLSWAFFFLINLRLFLYFYIKSGYYGSDLIVPIMSSSFLAQFKTPIYKHANKTLSSTPWWSTWQNLIKKWLACDPCRRSSFLTHSSCETSWFIHLSQGWAPSLFVQGALLYRMVGHNAQLLVCAISPYI